MPEETFKVALQNKLDHLKAEIKLAQNEIEEKECIVEHRQEQLEHVIKLLEAEGVQVDRTKLDGTVPVTLAEVIATVLRARGPQAMHYKEITELVQQAGHKILGQNPHATIIALLHRKKDQFARLAPGIWGLAEWGLPSRVLRTDKRRKTRRKTNRKTG